ncbi:hypothetical protein A8B98_18760 [Hymenobacter sp. UV11]|nr:hypothetical protein A8B98_18760 [Hymenobacter sp. UV11]
MASLWLVLGLLTLQCRRLPGVAYAAGPHAEPVVVRPAGATRALLIRATLLLPHQVLAPGELLLDAQGRIACVGPDCSAHPAAQGATVIEAPGSVVSPGLLNAHDHLPFDHLRPRPVTERYTNRHQWRMGLDGHAKLVIVPDSTPARLVWSELRQLVVGTTSIVGGAPGPGLLRNLDRVDHRLGLTQPTVQYLVFPLWDKPTGPRLNDCGYPLFTRAPALPPTGPVGNLVAHVGEGTDAATTNEFRCLAGLLPGSYQALPDGSVLIHAMALARSDAQWLAAHRMSVVWAPHSNLALYGQTAPVLRYDSLGINLLLGTDWALTGSATLPEELRYAAAYNQARLHSHFTDQQLWQMVTRNAAQGLGLAGQLGELTVGAWADVVLYDGRGCATPYQAVLRARPATTQLVLRAGQPLYGDARLLRRLPASRGRSQPLRIGRGGPRKRVCLDPEVPVTLQELRRANRTAIALDPTPPAPAF